METHFNKINICGMFFHSSHLKLITNTLMENALLLSVHCYCSPEVIHMYISAKQIVVEVMKKNQKDNIANTIM